MISGTTTNTLYVKAESGNRLLYNNRYFRSAFLPSTVDVSAVTEIAETSFPIFLAKELGPSPKQIKLLTGSQEPTNDIGNIDDIFIVLDTSVSITYTLFHCSSEYTGATAHLGDMLISRIVPTYDYTLGTITVTMDGTDITASSVFGDRIIIPKISGPITISCAATSNTVADAVGSINSSTNDITLNGTLSSGTYTLWYEDSTGTKLNGWAQIAEITK